MTSAVVRRFLPFAPSQTAVTKNFFTWFVDAFLSRKKLAKGCPALESPTAAIVGGRGELSAARVVALTIVGAAFNIRSNWAPTHA